MPKVSIVIPVHNGEKTIARSLESISRQTYRDFETVLVNNNCTDKTLEIAEKYSSRDAANIRVVDCATAGIVPALNTGIQHSNSRYIARQDDDDYWYKEKLQKQVEFLDGNPEISIVGTQIRILNEDGVPQKLGTYGKAIVYPQIDEEIRLMMLLGQNPFCHPSVLIRSEVFLRVGGYSQFFHLAEDLDLWLRAFPFFKFSNLEEVLIDYTQTIREDYDPRVTQYMSKMYWSLYQACGLVAGDRPDITYEWETKA